VTDDDRKAFGEIFGRLALALREKVTDVLVIRVYFDTLKVLPLEFVREAADRCARTAVYFPKTSEWYGLAVRVAAERTEAHRARLRRLPAPLCEDCRDTGWRPVGNSVERCDCRALRQLERLGRRPWPELPPASA
jgi:hypothetical protein